jgi:hypothetical protein
MNAVAPLPAPGPTRAVHHGDALAWLRANGPLTGASVITSLPDLSELPALDLAGWRDWFIDAAALTMSSLTDDGVAFFYQSDIRHGGRWVDKGALVQAAGARASMSLLFHKIVCRKPPGTTSLGRASYAHLLAFARGARPTPRRPTPDVLPDPGFVPGRKAMGAAACLLACRHILDETPTRTVVDPFCGWGTALAVANAVGLDAIGVDLSARMCRRARQLVLRVDGDQVEP